jgi:hypothetical protein
MCIHKRTELIRRVKRFETANHRCLVIKYARDTRYDDGDCISTHDKLFKFIIYVNYFQFKDKKLTKKIKELICSC